MRLKIILFAVLCSFSAHADDSKSKWSNWLEPNSSPSSEIDSKSDIIKLTAVAHLGDSETYKMAYIVGVHQRARFKADTDPALSRDPVAKTKFIEAEDRRAEIEMNGQDLRLVQAIIKDGIQGGSEGLSKLIQFKMPTNTLELLASDEIERERYKGRTPDLSIEDVFRRTAYTLAVAKDDANPDHDWAAKMLRKYPKIDSELPYGTLKKTSDLVERLELRENLADILSAIGKGQISREGADRRMKELLGQTSVGLAILKEKIDEIQKEQREDRQKKADKERRELQERQLRAQLNEISDAMGFGAGVATLFQNNEAARIFNDLQRLVYLSNQLANISDSFSDNPMAYCNIYVAMAVVISNIMQSQKRDQEMTQLFDALNQIAEQIEKLRREMHERFDILEAKIDAYFRNTYFELGNLKASSIRLHQLASRLLEEEEENAAQIQTGLKQQLLLQLTDWETLCYGTKPDGSFDRRDGALIQRCRNQFAQMSLSRWDTPLNEPLSQSETIKAFSELSNSEYRTLKEMIGTVDPTTLFSQTLIHPSNYVLGIREFIRLFQKNPGFDEYILSSNTERVDLSIENLIATGNSVALGLETLGLSAKDDGYQLKKGLFESFLKRYREQASEAIRLGLDAGDLQSNGGPNPFVREKQQLPLDTEYAFLKSHPNLSWCDGAAHVATVKRYFDSWDDEPNRPKNVMGVAFGGDPEEVNGFKWNNTFLPLISPKFAWAYRMKDKNGNPQFDIDIKPCIRQVDFPEMIIGVQETRFHFHIVLEIWGKTKSETKFFLLNRAVLDENYEYHPGLGKFHFNILENLWNGQSEPDRSQMFTRAGGKNFNWEAITKGAHKRFRREELDESEKSDEYKNFERELNAVWDRAKTESESWMQLQLQSQKVSADRLLFLLATLSLDHQSEAVGKFLDWSMSPASLPSISEIARVAMESKANEATLGPIVDKHVSNASAKVNELSLATDLQPRSREVEQLVNYLKDQRKRLSKAAN